MSFRIKKVNGVDYSGTEQQNQQQTESGRQPPSRPVVHLTLPGQNTQGGGPSHGDQTSSNGESQQHSGAGQPTQSRPVVHLTFSDQNTQGGGPSHGDQTSSNGNPQASAYARQIEQLQGEIEQKDRLIESLQRSISDFGMYSDDLQALNDQLTDMSRQVESKGAEVNGLLRESDKLDRDIANLEQEIKKKEQHAAHLDKQMRQEAKELACLTDEELISAVDKARKRYQELMDKAAHAEDDLGKDGEQLKQMHGSEFIDPVQLKALQDEYNGLLKQFSDFQSRIKHLCIDARKKSEKRTTDLFDE